MLFGNRMNAKHAIPPSTAATSLIQSCSESRPDGISVFMGFSAEPCAIISSYFCFYS
jgi:hypothetical protein